MGFVILFSSFIIKIIIHVSKLHSILLFQGEQSRQIRHFHFTSWPDFGVPKKEQVLVRFVRMVREKLFKESGPIIVHCRYVTVYIISLLLPIGYFGVGCWNSNTVWQRSGCFGHTILVTSFFFVSYFSAGVGRSGTFVVLDRLLQHIKTHDTVDIFSSVAELRRERVWMVQTEVPYVSLFNVNQKFSASVNICERRLLWRICTKLIWICNLACDMR